MQLFENIACTVCGCVCDEFRITVENGRIAKCEVPVHCPNPGCSARTAGRPPVALIDGQPVPLEQAALEAARILSESNSPLVCGLSRSSTEGQAVPSPWAKVGATIDTTASLCHANSVMAVQEVGEVDLHAGRDSEPGRSRDLLGLGSGREPSAPSGRYSLLPTAGMSRGAADRTLVVADVRRRRRRWRPSFSSIERGHDFERSDVPCLVRGGRSMRRVVGALLPMLEDLAGRMRKCRYGRVFFGVGLSMTTWATKTSRPCCFW